MYWCDIVFENSHYLRNFPGPGAYESKPVLNNNGVYFVSKFKNSGACTINPSKSARFANYRGTNFIDFLLKMILVSNKNSPGPGEYSPREQLNPAGSYFVSKYQSFGTRTFYHFDRDTLRLPENARSTQNTFIEVL